VVFDVMGSCGFGACFGEGILDDLPYSTFNLLFAFVITTIVLSDECFEIRQLRQLVDKETRRAFQHIGKRVMVNHEGRINRLSIDNLIKQA